VPTIDESLYLSPESLLLLLVVSSLMMRIMMDRFIVQDFEWMARAHFLNRVCGINFVLKFLHKIEHS
jgi:hypothetical protein